MGLSDLRTLGSDQAQWLIFENRSEKISQISGSELSFSRLRLQWIKKQSNNLAEIDVKTIYRILFPLLVAFLCILPFSFVGSGKCVSVGSGDTCNIHLAKASEITLVTTINSYGRETELVLVEGEKVNAGWLKASSSWNSENRVRRENISLQGRGLRTQPMAIVSEKSKPTEDIVYHVNVRSRVFHHPRCMHYNCKNCTAVFYSREEAIKAGYRPCRICNP